MNKVFDNTFGGGSGGGGTPVRSDVMGNGNVWQEGASYPLINTQVFDSGWLGINLIANPTERPAPQADGDPETSIPSLTWNFENETAVLQAQHLYIFQETGWFQKVLVYVPEISATTTYRVFLRDETDPDPSKWIIEQATIPVTASNQWVEVATGSHIVVIGTKIRIALISYNESGETNVTGGWTAGGSSNSVPATSSWNRSSNNRIVRIDKTDLDTTDRSTELLGALPESTIQFSETLDTTKSISFIVLDTPIDGGTYIEYSVNRLQVGTGGEPTVGQASTLNLDIPIPLPTQYVVQPDYWTLNQPDFATITTVLEADGVDQVKPTTDAYGIDILFQKAYVSDQWLLVSNSSGTSTSGGGAVNIAQYDLLYSVFSEELTQVPAGNSTDEGFVVNFTPIDVGGVADPVQLYNDVDNGTIVKINRSDVYTFRGGFQYSRAVSAQEVEIFGRILFRVNELAPWIQFGTPSLAEFTDQNINLPARADFTLPLSAGNEIKIELVRSSDKFNDGGLYRVEPSAGMELLNPPWTFASSAFLNIIRVKNTQTVAHPELGYRGRGTTTERNLLTDVEAGQQWFNTDHNVVENYDSDGVWLNCHLRKVVNNTGSTLEEGLSVLIENVATALGTPPKIGFSNLLGDGKIYGLVVGGDFSPNGICSIAVSGIYNGISDTNMLTGYFARTTGLGDGKNDALFNPNRGSFGVVLADTTAGQLTPIDLDGVERTG